MIRGLYIGRATVSAGITFIVMLFRALAKMYPSDQFYQLMIDPVLVFVLFLIAGVIVMYPYLTGRKALFIAPLMVCLILFFVYAYYIL
jgi:hypothetical protein